MSMDRNTVLGVTSLDSLFVFAESYLEGLLIFGPLIPFGRPHVGTWFDTTFWSAVKQHCLH